MSFHKIFSSLDPSAPRKTHAMVPGITEVESVFRECAAYEWGTPVVASSRQGGMSHGAAHGHGLMGHDAEFDNLVKGLLPTQLLVIGMSPSYLPSPRAICPGATLGRQTRC